MQGKSNRASLHLMSNEGSNSENALQAPETVLSVIPVKTGIQEFQELLDARLRGSDRCKEYL
jgi:hypothetical protein